jgi:hypothetical protein
MYGALVYVDRGASRAQDRLTRAWHFLRRLAASLFIAYLGWTPERVQEVMGHSSITVTYDTYAGCHLAGNAWPRNRNKSRS